MSLRAPQPEPAEKLIMRLVDGPEWVWLPVPEDAPNYHALRLILLCLPRPVRVTRDAEGIRYDPGPETPEHDHRTNQIIVQSYRHTIASMPMGTWMLCAEVPDAS